MKPWAFSTLEKFETCPRQFHEIKILKSVVEPESEHQLWGKQVHSAFENYIKGGGKPKAQLPEKMKHWQNIVDNLFSMPARQILTEVQVALDRNFQVVAWDSDQCWTRGVIDVLVLGSTSAIVLDWKTGKRKPTEQLKLYAAYVFAVYPKVNVVSTALVWLQSRRIDKDTIVRSDAPGIWQGFIERAARLKSAHERDSWPERPSGLCRAWCAVTQCKYNGKGEIPIWSGRNTIT
jgi:hypothetical protein